ncbi:MAG: transcription initiation factor IIB family protein [Candidatus Caldarchaeum sp.]
MHRGQLNPCPFCGSAERRYDQAVGEVICASCGTVIAEREPSTTPPKKMFFNGKNSVGPGLTSLLHDRGLGTVKTSRLSSPNEKLLSRLLSEVVWVSDKLVLPKHVAEKAGELVRLAVAEGVFRRSRRASAAAAVYIASNHLNHSKTLQELAAAADVPVALLAKEVSRTVFGLNLKAKAPDYEMFMHRIARTLNLEHEVLEEGCRILKEWRERNLVAGRKPSSVAAAAVYFACRRLGVKVYVARLAEAGCVSAPTLKRIITYLERS